MYPLHLVLKRLHTIFMIKKIKINDCKNVMQGKHFVTSIKIFTHPYLLLFFLNVFTFVKVKKNIFKLNIYNELFIHEYHHNVSTRLVLS